MRFVPAGENVGSARWLLLVPLATYLLSYLFLAAYHGRLWLWTTVVHESGRYTLFETTFYASHFLGHTPVLITIALLFAGSWLTMTPAPEQPISGRWTAVVIALICLLLAVSVVIAVSHFGLDDTLDFLCQHKQRTDLLVEGGSWNLHLPSTMLQFLLIPVIVWVTRRLFCRPIVWSRRGVVWLVAAAAIATAITGLANTQPLTAVAGVWRDPRHLAHSVREVATFPLTCYPLPMAVLLFLERPTGNRRLTGGAVHSALIAAAVLFLIGFGYQVVISLVNDVGSLAQHPDFAPGGKLSIAYLLSSHYFEHVLDSLFFALLTLLLVAIPGRDVISARHSDSKFEIRNSNS